MLPGGETFDPTAPRYSDPMNVTASAKIEYTTNKDGRVHFGPASQ